MQYFSYHNLECSKENNATELNCKGSKFLALLYSLPATQEFSRAITKDSMPQTLQQKDSLAESTALRNALLADL